MAHRGWFQLGDTELVNTVRTVAYARAGVLNASARVVTDDSWPMLPRWLGREEYYRRPEADDDCPWRDRSESASAEFAGVWPMSVEGLDTTPADREVVESAVVGGGFGVLRTPPRSVTVEALLIGSTPAGLRYGLEWLSGVLRGTGEVDRQLLFLDSTPPFDARATAEQIRRLADAHVRMLANVALTEPVKIEETFSPWVADGHGATVARVSFELTAGIPWMWRLPTPLVEGLQPWRGEPEVARFEHAGVDGVCPGTCVEDLPILVDPTSQPLSLLPRPLTPAAHAACEPLESRSLRWVLEPGRVPRWAETLPTVTIHTGAREERSIRLQWAQGNITRPGRDFACASVGEAMVGYLPAESTCTLDAVTGEATVVTKDGQRLDATPVVTGRWGGPWRAPVLEGSSPYTLLIDTEEAVDRGVRIDIDAVVRQP